MKRGRAVCNWERTSLENCQGSGYHFLDCKMINSIAGFWLPTAWSAVLHVTELGMLTPGPGGKDPLRLLRTSSWDRVG